MAELIPWPVEIEILTREYELLENLADDLADPKLAAELFAAKDWVENLLGGD